MYSRKIARHSFCSSFTIEWISWETNFQRKMRDNSLVATCILFEAVTVACSNNERVNKEYKDIGKKTWKQYESLEIDFSTSFVKSSRMEILFSFPKFRVGFARWKFPSLSLSRQVWNTGGRESRENVAGFMLLCLPSHLACPVNEVRNTMVLRCWWPLPILAPPLPAPGKSRSRSFFLLAFPSASFPTRFNHSPLNAARVFASRLGLQRLRTPCTTTTLPRPVESIRTTSK